MPHSVSLASRCFRLFLELLVHRVTGFAGQEHLLELQHVLGLQEADTSGSPQHAADVLRRSD